MSRARQSMKFEEQLVDLVLEMDKQKREAATLGNIALVAANHPVPIDPSNPNTRDERSFEAESELSPVIVQPAD